MQAALTELIQAIMQSSEYQTYEREKENMRRNPALKERVNAFRAENFQLQEMPPKEAFDRLDEFTDKYEDLRNDPQARAFLNAEWDFCRMVQGINQKIVEAVDFE